MSLNPLRWLFRPHRSSRRKRALVRVLMVCRANICRSPMAEATFGRLVAQAGLADLIYVDSAGTHVQGAGIAPDPRGQKTAGSRNIDLSQIRTRRVQVRDLDDFDYVLAMDESNYENLLALAKTPEQRGRIMLLLPFSMNKIGREVPDPYYGGTAGFEHVMNLLELATEGLLAHIRRERNL